jgi:hypothetical protein
MRKIIFLLSFFSLLVPATVAAQFNRPSLDSVVAHFFNKYKYEGSFPNELRFASAPSGWYVYEVNLNQAGGHYAGGELLWSAATKTYNDSSKFESNNGWAYKNEAANDYLQRAIYGNGLDYNYTHCGYFGYDGWDMDIINEWESKEQMSDEWLESLARAYSNYAAGFIYDQYNFMANRQLPDRQALPAAETPGRSRIDSFSFYVQKGIDTYQKLHRQNPTYETIVGPVFEKYSNEHLYAFSTLMMAGYPADARRFIKPGLYSDSLLQTARAYLEPVKPNGILFTYGDNDTYPLWYLQEKEGLKKNAAVINFSLLNLPRYLGMLHRQTGGLFFSTKPAVFYPESFTYGGTYNKSASVAASKAFPLADFLRNWQSGTQTRSIETGDGKTIKMQQYAVKKIAFTIDKPKATALFKGISLAPSVNIELGNYLSGAQFIMLDIVHTHFYKRPIYFTWKGSDNLLSNYFAPGKKVYQLLPKASPAKAKENHNGHHH